MNAANPKVLLFYTAIVPQFVNPQVPIVPQMLVLGVTGLSVGVVISGGYAVMAACMARRLAAPQYATITNRITGSLLIAAGAGMAALRRS
jgi:homoserine/homoserine lactone efflux protein